MSCFLCRLVSPLWLKLMQLHIQIVWNKWNDHKKFNYQYSGGGNINHPGQLAPCLCNQAYETERQSLHLNLTCFMTVIDASSYSGILKQVKWSFKNLPINTQAGGKINRLQPSIRNWTTIKVYSLIWLALWLLLKQLHIQIVWNKWNDH